MRTRLCGQADSFNHERHPIFFPRRTEPYLHQHPAGNSSRRAKTFPHLARLSCLLPVLTCLLLLLAGVAQAQTDLLIVINEIMKDPHAVGDTSGEWLELYNAGSQPFDLNGCTLGDDAGDLHLINHNGPLLIDPGAYLVLGNNGSAGSNGGLNLDYVYTGFNLANGADNVVLLCNDLEIDRVNYDDGQTFPDPVGFSLQLKEPTLDNNVGANWCQAASPWPGSAGDSGTPGGPTVCATFSGKVVINELMADPAAVSDSNGEWLELYNPGSSAVDIHGCRLKGTTSADNHFINNGGPLVIKPNQYLMIGANSDPALNGGVVIDYTYMLFSLTNSNDTVLLECAGQVIDQVNYNPAFRGPVAGASMQLAIPSLDNNVASNWCNAPTPWPGSAGDKGTPGIVNNCPADLVLSKKAPGTAVAGQRLTYTLVYANNGPSAAANVVITDIVPKGLTNVNYTSSGAALTPTGGPDYVWRVADLRRNEGGVITITGFIAPDFSDSVIINTASITSTALVTTNNHTASATTTVTTEADLSLSKADTPDPVSVNDSLNYSLLVTNAGPSAATAITVTDTLPPGTGFVNAAGAGWRCNQTGGIVTCTRPRLDPGDAPELVITVTAPDAAGVITNTAEVTSSITDPTPFNEATETTTVTALEADLSLSKRDTPDPVSSGGLLTYILEVSNSGPNTATAITVTDTLPAGTTFVDAAGTGWSCSESLGVVTCTRANLAVGSAPDIRITVAAPDAAGLITNTATLTSGVADPTLPNTAVATTTVTTPEADLTIGKQDSPDPVVAGGTLNYTLSVSNRGPDPATAVTVSDTLPGGVNFIGASGFGWDCRQAGQLVTCTRPNLAVGSAPIIVITVTTPAEAGIITNTVEVTSEVNDPNLLNMAVATTTVSAPEADLTLSKKDTPDPVLSGGRLTYTLRVNNAGPVEASAITVTDTLPAGVSFVEVTGAGWSCGENAGVVTCTRPSLPLGPAPDILIGVVAPTTAGVITNSAMVSSATADPSGPNAAVENTTVSLLAADLVLSKEDAPDPVSAGETLTYTLTVSNLGPDEATDITVTDTLPTGVSFVSASGPGWSCRQAAGVVTCTRPNLAVADAADILISVTAPDTAGVITNSATVAAGVADPTLPNTVTAATTVTGLEADLSLTKFDTPDPVLANQSLTYTLRVNNIGPNAATAITVTDILPVGTIFVNATGAGWFCNETGGTVTCTRPALDLGSAPDIVIRVIAPSEAGFITNIATVASAVADPSPPNTAIAMTTVTAAATADMTLTQNDVPDPVKVSGTLTYTLNVNNAGPNPATAITVTNILPNGTVLINATGAGWNCSQAGGIVTCTRPALDVGSAPDILISVTAPGVAGVITNTASVTSDIPDPTLPNISVATTTVTADAAADLSLLKSDEPDPAITGDILTYTLKVSNAGPSVAPAITVTDTLPAGVIFSSAVGAGWNCGQAGGIVTCTRANLAVGSAPDILIRVIAPSGAGVITNTAAVVSTLADPALPNTALATTTVQAPAADLSLSKEGAPEPVTVGEPLTYTLKVSNAGPSAASAITVTDSLPAGVIFSSAVGAGWDCGSAGQVLLCTRPSLGIGSAPDILVSVIAPGAAGVITNTATVASATPDPTLPNTAVISTTVAGLPAVRFGETVYSVNEVEGTATILVSLSAASARPIRVDYASSDNTATAGSDYVAAIGTLIFTPGVVAQSFTVVITDDGLSEASESLVLSLSNPVNATLGTPNRALLFIEDTGGAAPSSVIYLPFISHDFVLAPDLVVHRLTAGSNAVTVTLKNVGNVASSDAFWVDVYLNPNPPPSQVNQEWWELAPEGLVWGVTETIPAGGELTLTLGDVHYSARYSQFSGAIPAGTPVWAQVDSVNTNTTYGGVLESDEINNISGPVPAEALEMGLIMPSALGETRKFFLGDLPPR